MIDGTEDHPDSLLGEVLPVEPTVDERLLNFGVDRPTIGFLTGCEQGCLDGASNRFLVHLCLSGFAEDIDEALTVTTSVGPGEHSTNDPRLHCNCRPKVVGQSELRVWNATQPSEEGKSSGDVL